jgi:hypothetical protein
LKSPTAPSSIVRPSVGPPLPPPTPVSPLVPEDVQSAQDSVKNIVGKSVYKQLNPSTQDFTIRLTNDVSALVSNHNILVNSLSPGPLQTIGTTIANILPSMSNAAVGIFSPVLEDFSNRALSYSYVPTSTDINTSTVSFFAKLASSELGVISQGLSLILSEKIESYLSRLLLDSQVTLAILQGYPALIQELANDCELVGSTSAIQWNKQGSNARISGALDLSDLLTNLSEKTFLDWSMNNAQVLASHQTITSTGENQYNELQELYSCVIYSSCIQQLQNNQNLRNLSSQSLQTTLSSSSSQNLASFIQQLVSKVLSYNLSQESVIGIPSL